MPQSPRTTRLKAAVAAGALALLGAPAVQASIVTYMDTADLVRVSPVIVRGEIESIVSRSDAGYSVITTDVGVRVVESLRGAAGVPRLHFRIPGGSVDGHASFVYGAPAFDKGERVLLFLQPAKDGVLTVAGLFQGKFRIETQAGVDVAVKPRQVEATPPRTGQVREPEQRPLAALLEELRDLVRYRPAQTRRAFTLATQPLAAAVSSPDLGFTLRPLIPLRWFEPDSGLPVTMMFNPANAPTVVPGGARPQFAAATVNWTNVTGSTIVMQDGGDTTAACDRKDGVSSVSHGDPCNQFPDFDPVTCSGVLAVTGVSNFNLQSKVVNGVSFLRFLEEDIVINGDTDCFFVDPGNYGEVVGHEMGHVTGLGHSCGDQFSPDCATDPVADAALMNAFAHGDGRGPTPQRGDINGVRFMYPPPGFVEAHVSSPAVSTGQTLAFDVDFNGTAHADVYAILGFPGGGFLALGASALNVLAPLATNVQLGFSPNVPLFSHVFGGTETAGTYNWYVILVPPGTPPSQTASWLSFSTTSFTFTP